MEELQREGLWTPENVLFLLAIRFQHLHPDLLEYVSHFPDANKVGSKFVEYVDGALRLKKQEDNDYDQFLRELKADDINIDSYGHLANRLSYSINLTHPDAKTQFAILRLKYPDVNLRYMAELTRDYYEAGSYRKTFANFIRDVLAAQIST